MRIALDSSAAFRLLRNRAGTVWLRGVIARHTISITSAYILTEVERVLYEKGGASRQKAKVATRALAFASTMVNQLNIRPVCRDPKDDPVLALHWRAKQNIL